MHVNMHLNHIVMMIIIIIMKKKKKVTFRWLLHCAHTGTILQNLYKTLKILHFSYLNAIFPSGQRGLHPSRRRPLGGFQNSIFSMKSQLNFEVTFTCHFEPLYGPTWLQLSSNLASKIPPKPVSRRCWNATSWKADFCNLSIATCKFLLLPGAPKTSKNAFQDHFLYECLFN